MKKRIIIMGVIVIILAAIILNHKNIYRFYKLNQISIDVVNSINGNFNSRIFEETIQDYERLHKSIEELNHYDITELINQYIEMAVKSVDVYKSDVRKRFLGGFEKINERINLVYGKDIWLTRSGELCIEDNFSDEDIKNYDNGIFRTQLVEKLKKVLDYEENDDKIEWKINSTKDERIELPYDCYIDYTAYCVGMNKEFEKAISVDMSKYNLEEIDNRVVVTYQTKDNKKKEQEVWVYKRDKQIYVWLSDILTDKKGCALAEAYLGSHTVDRKKEESDLRAIGEWFDN